MKTISTQSRHTSTQHNNRSRVAQRSARTFHYDGVPSGIKEPVRIAIFGLGPVDIELADPKQPPWPKVWVANATES